VQSLKQPWYTTLWRCGIWVMPRVLLPALFIALPAVVLFGYQNPEVGAMAALQLKSGEVPLLVGVGRGFRCVGKSCSEESTHTYLIWPSFSGASVSETRDGRKVAPVPVRESSLQWSGWWVAGARGGTG
jgi:hypothetical protein